SARPAEYAVRGRCMAAMQESMSSAAWISSSVRIRTSRRTREAYYRRMPKRCGWAAGGDELSLRYHDEEWGVPSHDDRHLFEMLVLEGAQAGLSWTTILRKREGYRKAFSGFDPAKVARFDSQKVERLLADPAIVRNRAKVQAAVAN